MKWRKIGAYHWRGKYNGFTYLLHGGRRWQNQGEFHFSLDVWSDISPTQRLLTITFVAHSDKTVARMAKKMRNRALDSHTASLL